MCKSCAHAIPISSVAYLAQHARDERTAGRGRSLAVQVFTHSLGEVAHRRWAIGCARDFSVEPATCQDFKQHLKAANTCAWRPLPTASLSRLFSEGVSRLLDVAEGFQLLQGRGVQPLQAFRA